MNRGEEPGRDHRYHDGMSIAKRHFEPVHPGEVLLEEFLRPLGISQYRLAKAISVPQRRISEIARGKRSVTADTALRLGRYFGMEAQFWLNLQSRCDLLCAEAALDSRLEEGESRRLGCIGKTRGSSVRPQ
jgi:addiction module HigA family antidote